MQELLLEARSVPPNERGRWLAERCHGDDAMRLEIESLLAHDAQEPSILSPGVAGEALARRIETEPTPERIGPYRVLEVLGEGGMGVVYRARQEGELPREVALKLLRRGATSPSTRLRFDIERAVLARMEHPGIAQVYAAGSDAEGRPWVAMELVSGLPITRWCDENRATLRTRVELLRDVCAAIQHAHQKGVLHRDLKPSNILVDESDGRTRARVIDFGIAKGLDETLTDAQTLAGELIGTPQYMSPEQAGAGGAALDTRSDVYSLGVVLYELLVGDTPIGRKTLSERGLADTLLLLRERQVSPPSVRFRALQLTEQESVAAGRSSRPRSLLRELHGDLDAIVIRALEREPSRRYGSVAELADELHRWLRREPVQAALPGPRRRLAAAVRRHRVVFAAVLSGAIVLFAGVSTTVWQATSAQRERAVAEQRLEDIRSFVMEFIFELDAKIGRLAGAIEARQYLSEQTVEQLARISQDPQARARLRLSLAIAHRKLGSLQRELGDAQAAEGSLRTAEELLREELAANPDALPPRRQLAIVFDVRSNLLQTAGDPKAALANGEAALHEFETIARLDPTGSNAQMDLNVIRSNLAVKLIAAGRREEGLRMRELSIEGRRSFVREHPDDLTEIVRLAREIRRLAEYWEDDGRTDLSDPYYSEMLALQRGIYEREPTNLNYKQELGGALHSAGRHLCVMDHIEEGLSLLRDAQRVREEIVAENPSQLRHVTSLMRTLCTIGETESRRNRASVALQLYERADSLGADAVLTGPGNAIILNELAWAKQLIGRVHMERGHLARSLRFFNDALTTLDDVPADDDEAQPWRRASIECDLGDLHARRAEGQRAAAALEDWQTAQSWYQRGLTRMRDMREQGGLAQWQLDEIPWCQRNAASADSMLLVARAKR